MPMIEMDPNGVWARSPRWARWALVISALFALTALILSAALEDRSFPPMIDQAETRD